MKRTAGKYLNLWFQRKKRKPLVLRGARQVGKSTLIRQFAKLQGLTLLEINLEKQKLSSLQEEGIRMANLLQEIEIICNQPLTANSLIFFDEIQEQPKLLSVLRYFYEDYPQLAVIAAGSLLEFALSQEIYSVPVGRIEYYFLGPMKFSEFLEALEERVLLEYLQKTPKSFIEAAHARLVARYKEYLFVGGMPEAVETYVRTSSPLEVRRVQRSILQTYEDDFIKYAKHSQIERLRRVFNFVPGHLGQKVKFSEIDREEKSRDMKAALNLLIQARIVLPVYHTNASGLPLKAQADDSVLKLYFLDVGLTNCLQGTEWRALTSLSQVDMTNKGATAEQFIAQHLFYKDDGFESPELFYWLRDKKRQNAEVDFVVSKGARIIPIEVKAEVSGRLKSLLVFMAEKQQPTAVKMDLNHLQSELVEKSIQTSPEPVVFELLTIPLYLVERLEDLCK
jgi:hypothetical protein